MGMAEELFTQRQRAEAAETNLHAALDLLDYLNRQEWYKNNRHTIPKNLLILADIPRHELRRNPKLFRP